MKRLAALLVVLAAVAAWSHPASAGWPISGPGTSAATRAQTMPAGNTPSASASGSAVTLSWSASSFADGPEVAAYTVRRYDAATLIPAPVGTQCSGGVNQATSCVELVVPDGSWRYTVQPLHNQWVGAESAMSAPVTVADDYRLAVLADAPAYYYRLDESGGPLMADSSGNARHGTYGTVGLTWQRPGVVGAGHTAVASTGTEAIGTTNPASALPTGNASRSVEVWFRTTSTGNQGLIGWGSSTPSTAHSQISLVGGALIQTSSGNLVALPSFAADGAWHHVVWTFTSGAPNGTARIYFDSVLVLTSGPFSLATTTGQPLRIGSSTTTLFHGELDEVAVYPTALSQARVDAHFAAAAQSQPLPTAPTNVVGVPGTDSATISWSPSSIAADRYPISAYVVTATRGSTVVGVQFTNPATTSTTFTGLDGGFGHTFTVTANNAMGASPSASTGLLIGGTGTSYRARILADGATNYFRLDDPVGPAYAPTPMRNYVVGNGNGSYNTAAVRGVGGALLFDSDAAASNGGSQIGSFGGGAGMPTGNNVRSFETWFRTTSTGTHALLNHGSSGNFFTVRIVGGNTLRYSISNTTMADVAVPDFVTDGLWHHVVLTYSGSSMIYFDGVRFASTSASFTTGTGETLALGSASGTTAFPGSLDEVAIYSTQLTAAQVAAHFAASGHQAAPPAPASILAIPAADSASVSWSSAVPQAGRLPATGYVVTARLGSAVVGTQSVDVPSTTTTFTGLDGGAAYTFDVAGVNLFGAGLTGASNTVTTSGTNVSYATTVRSDTPLSYYRLDEPLGSTLNRLPMRDYTGTRSGAYAVSGLTRGVAGALPGDSDTAVTASNVAVGLLTGTGLPSGNGPVSVEAWFKTTSTGTLGLVSWGSSTTTMVLLVTGGNTIEFSRGGGLMGSVAVPSFSTDGLWHHVVYTYASGTARVYYDGALATTLTGLTLNLNTGTLRIGSTPTNQHLTGSLDEVALYASELTAAQVAAHYAARL